MTEIPKCPTCGRRPSERTDIVLAGETARKCVVTPLCADPIHDAADLGPAAVALLREWSAEGESMAWVRRVDALLASLPVKP